MDFKKSILILMLVTVASFLPALSADFVNWDDDAHVLQNKLVLNFTATEIPKIFLQAGRIYFEEKRLPDALKMFEGAVKAEPENAQALFNLASVYANMGDKAKAQSLFSQAQVKWLKDPEKYPLPGLDAKDAKIWAARIGK